MKIKSQMLHVCCAIFYVYSNLTSMLLKEAATVTSMHEQLLFAAREGDAGTINMLCRWYESEKDSADFAFFTPNCRDDDGNTPLIYAAQNGHEDALVQLFGFEALEVNAVNKKGSNALMIASARGRLAIVKIFFEEAEKTKKKINIDGENKAHKTALMLAEENKHFDIATLLRMQGAQKGLDCKE